MCHYCQPNSPVLTGPLCPDCQAIYDLHERAGEDADAEAEAVKWIWENAPHFRRAHNDRRREIAAEQFGRVEITEIKLSEVNGPGRRRVRAE